jgi:hypothetical protein
LFTRGGKKLHTVYLMLLLWQSNLKQSSGKESRVPTVAKVQGSGNVTHAHTPIERFALKAHGFLFKDGNTLNVLTIERSLTPHNRWCCQRINRRKVSRWVNIVILSSEGLLNVVYCGVNWTGRKREKKNRQWIIYNLKIIDGIIAARAAFQSGIIFTIALDFQLGVHETDRGWREFAV